METTSEDLKKYEFIASVIWPHGDNYSARIIKGGRVEISFSNDYPMQHGKGSSMILEKRLAELIYSNHKFIEQVDLKMKEADEKGDGECPGSAYWYKCGLYDAKEVFKNFK